MSNPFRDAMMLGIAVDTTVCSSETTVIADSNAIVTILRSAREPRLGLDPWADSDCDPVIEPIPPPKATPPPVVDPDPGATRGHSRGHAKGGSGEGKRPEIVGREIKTEIHPRMTMRGAERDWQSDPREEA